MKKIFLLSIILLIAISFWTDRNLDYLFSLINHEATNIPIWISFIISLVGNIFTIIFNIIIELIRYIKI